MSSKVSLNIDGDGDTIALITAGKKDAGELKLNKGDAKKGKKNNFELDFGKKRMKGIKPREQQEIMMFLQEAHSRGIPPEHLQHSNPAIVDLYRGMIGEAEEKSNSTIELPPNSNFQLVPSSDPKKREVWYVAGASGSGKSYIAKGLVEKYRELYPDRQVYLVSKLNDDETLDSLKPKLNRINISKLVDKPLPDLEPLRECMIIFDDYDTFQGKEAKVVQQLIDDIAIQGRHTITTMLCLTHYLSNYKKTRLLLTEATHFVLYPQSTGSHALNYLLQTYLGMDKEETAKLRKTGSRWVCIHKNYPQYVITETSAWIMNQAEDFEKE